jgi:subtilisin family serine protease
MFKIFIFNRKLLSLAIFLISTTSFAQTIILNTNGYKIQLRSVDTLFHAEYKISDAVLQPGFRFNSNYSQLRYNFGKILNRKNLFANLRRSIFQTKFYVYKDGTLQAPTTQLFFKPVHAASFIVKYRYLGKIEPHPSLRGFYNMEVSNKKYLTSEKIFALCNKLYNEKAVSIIEPVYIRLVKNTNPLRPKQWSIFNAGNVKGSIPGVDMGVQNAWTVATGKGIRVAVIDDGVDLTHPDLRQNLLPGYDATGNNSFGAPIKTNGHGTNCAGIIASVDNLIGTIGVAFNASIIPIRMGLVDSLDRFKTNDDWIAKCFSEAISRGADVISNSWGGGSQSVQINSAIKNAVSNGRNGLGAVVLFAAGNFNTQVQYPANNPYVIAVGASTPCDTRKRSSRNLNQLNPEVETDPLGVSCDGEYWWGSDFGEALDLLAPGVLITTTDNVGKNGIVAGDYNELFNGTSAACPNAAAVVALILSVNNSLTGKEARDILEQTCFKIPNITYQINAIDHPNGTWSPQAGYGRIQADSAVFRALKQITH